MIKNFLMDESGQTLVEYGLLISLLALVAIIGVSIFGRGMRDVLYNNINNGLSNSLATS